MSFVVICTVALVIAIASPLLAQDETGTTLSVLTSNIGHCSLFERPSVQDWVDVLGDGPKAEVVLLQDVQSQGQVQELAGRLGYAHWITDAAMRTQGSDLAIVSTREILGSHYLRLPSSPTHKGVLCAKIMVEGREVLVCSVHLDRVEPTPQIKNGQVDFPWIELFFQFWKEIFTPTVRSRSAGELLQWLQGLDKKRIVVGGDFNTIFLSRTIWAMCRQFEDALWPSWDFFQGTYKPFDFPIKPRIDYLFHSPSLECLAAGINSETAGDHFPVWAEFGSSSIDTLKMKESRVLSILLFMCLICSTMISKV